MSHHNIEDFKPLSVSPILECWPALESSASALGTEGSLNLYPLYHNNDDPLTICMRKSCAG